MVTIRSAQRKAPPPTANHKVLVVDDSKAITQLLRTGITESSQCEVVCCHDMASALEQLQRDPKDFFAAVLDLHLPDAPNGEIVDRILAMNIPSIVLTGDLNDATRFKILEKPIVDYVIKRNASEIAYVTELVHRLQKNPETKVLLVDDSMTFRAYLQGLLAVQRYRILTAEDGVQALDIVKNEPGIQLVLTDYHMPRMDGLELIRAIRDLYSRNEVCVIAVTESASQGLAARMLKAGANDIINKPFQVEEFYSRINNHISTLEHIRTIREMAIRDQLTGLYNRRYLFDVGKKLYASARAGKSKLNAAILDIDFFKKVNDTHGHDIGDIAIRQVADALRLLARKHDLAVRLGGEEFCLLLTNSREPRTFFEMLRRQIEQESIPLPNGDSFKITISIGVAGRLDDSLDKMLKIADDALYQAKHQGRNRVILLEGD